MATEIAQAVGVKQIVSDALHAEAAKSSNDMKASDAAKITETAAPKIEAAVNKEVGAIIENATNQEKIWQSRNFWTFLLVMVASAAGLLGYTFSAEDQASTVNTIMQLVQLAGVAGTALLGLYGLVNRVFFAGKLKPLFTK